MNRIFAAVGIALAAAGALLPTEAERIKALPEEERRWLTEFVAPIILPEERRVFLELTEQYQREFFKRDFWERRELDGLNPPLGPGYRERYAELRRLADEKYDGWRADAGRMVLRWGEPDSILSPRCAGEDVFFDLEVWTYGSAKQAASGRHILYRPADRAPRKLWTVADEIEPSQGRKTEVRDFEPPFRPNSCRWTMKSLRDDCASGSPGCNVCLDLCEVYRAYQEIRHRQGSKAGSAAELGKLFEARAISTEGLDRQKNRWASASNPNAKPLRVENTAISPTPSSAAAASVAAPAATPTPEPIHDLSDEEIRERLLALERPYREWLDYATPLLTREQLSRFLQLSSAEKDRFIREFWKKRK